MRGLNQDYPLILATVLEHAAANFAGVPLVSYNQGEVTRYDYRQMAARARRLASVLAAEGLAAEGLAAESDGPGNFIGSLAWNTHRHLELFYGASGIGAVLHTANPRLAPEHIAYTINFSGYRTLFVDPDTVALAEQILPRLEHVERFVVMAARDRMPTTRLPNVACYEDLIGPGDEEFSWPALDERMACALCFTSGTTGMPKGALYSHRGTVLSAMSTGGGNAWALSADDAILALPGFFHCNGWGIPFLAPMYGSKLVMPGRRMDTEFLHGLVLQEGITVGPAVPTIWMDMLEHCRRSGQGLGPLNRLFTGGIAPPATMIEAYLREHGVRTHHAWGMTETTHGATFSFTSRHAQGPHANSDAAIAAMRTQGKPAYGNQIRAVDDAGRVLPRDGKTPGHLQSRGHWIAGAYFRRPEVAVQTGDGWMETGDVAVIDPDNTLHIVDRAKDVIKSGGEWISSQALEEAACRHAGVQEAAVLAVPHPRWQERPLLIVVLRAGSTVTADELRDHLIPLVPKWWLPDDILFMPEFPHGPTGKIQKDALRKSLPPLFTP
jgi:acyl-CoA synthetase (AMP-forming)/AMP-acid ligase II